MESNIERQREEIEAIASICNNDEFFRIPSDYYNFCLHIPPFIKKEILDVKYSNVILRHGPIQPFHHFSVKNLPPTSLRFRLPPEYPESLAPVYKLDISWLSPWDCSLVCQRLDELSKDNEGSEILYIWQDFLRNELLSFLNYEESLDVSFLFILHSECENSKITDLMKFADSRAQNTALFLHPMNYLMQYDESRRNVILRRSFCVCGICFDEFSGKNCIEFHDCGHIYCNNCIAVYFAMRINDGNVERMPCPDSNCYAMAQSNQIKKLCPDLYGKYEEILLHLALRTMNDVVVCPRVSCQFPVIVVDGETLASCRKCEYNFCFYCRKVYHGVAPCVMTSEDSEKLITMYLKGNNAERKLLMKKYGRKQIQIIVESHLAKKYIKEKTKLCPKCRTPTEKISGCNKMVCVHCRANFCWICGILITSSNSYDHFITKSDKNKCYGRLFEGLLGIEDELMHLNETA